MDVSRLTRTAALGAAAAMALVVVPISSADAAKTRKFAQAGNWTIQAVSTDADVFNHCSARAVYKSGIEIFLIAYAGGVWSVQFYKPTWPTRAESTFPATLNVDGRDVMQTNGKFRGRSAFIELGRSVDRIRAIMQGRQMSVATPSGVSRFSLRGTSQAVQRVSECWAKYREAAVASNDGAFGSTPGRTAPPANEGAFGAPAAPNRDPSGQGSNGQASNGSQSEPSSARLSRNDTVPFAERYLRGARTGFNLIEADRNVFKHFPVNWRYENGALGGMMILQKSRFNAISGLESLLTDQAKWCKGRSVTDRKPTSGQVGRRVARARGVCEHSGREYVYDYSVAELSESRVVMILESRTTNVSPTPTPAAPRSTGKDRDLSTLSEKAPRGTEGGAPLSRLPQPRPNRQPGPNEL